MKKKFFNKKPSHLRGECRHQFKVLGEFKRGVDVAHENWLCVREGTPILEECPLHPKLRLVFIKTLKLKSNIHENKIMEFQKCK
ncbi:hypothetical protein Hanom_Chr10g00873421 [Helianthus anomalus]